MSFMKYVWPWGEIKRLERQADELFEHCEKSIQRVSDIADLQAEKDLNSMLKFFRDFSLAYIALTDMIAVADGVSNPNGTIKKMRRIGQEAMDRFMTSVNQDGLEAMRKASAREFEIFAAAEGTEYKSNEADVPEQLKSTRQASSVDSGVVPPATDILVNSNDSISSNDSYGGLRQRFGGGESADGGSSNDSYGGFGGGESGGGGSSGSWDSGSSSSDYSGGSSGDSGSW